MKRILQVLCWLLPASQFKNARLRGFGHVIAERVRIAPNLVVGVGRFEIGDRTNIGPCNVFRGVRRVRLAEQVDIRSWNWISAAPEFRTVDPQAGTLDMEFGSCINARSYLDCSGAIVVGAYSFVGGNRVFLQTHGIDLDEGCQVAGSVIIGHHSLVGSCCSMLRGAELPPRSVLGAKSLLRSGDTADGRSGVYVGSPATWRSATSGYWFERTEPRSLQGARIDGRMGPNE